MGEINVTSTKQKIIVDPAAYSVSVIYTGKPAPTPAPPVVVTSPWIPFTPRMWCGGQPATATMECYYTKVNRLVTARYAVKAVGYPVGQYDLELPVLAKVVNTTIFDLYWGSVLGPAYYVARGGTNYPGMALIDQGDRFYISGGSANGGPWKQAGPPIQASPGDQIYATITYEALN